MDPLTAGVRQYPCHKGRKHKVLTLYKGLRGLIQNMVLADETSCTGKSYKGECKIGETKSDPLVATSLFKYRSGKSGESLPRDMHRLRKYSKEWIQQLRDFG
jgi:hypothetical protein